MRNEGSKQGLYRTKKLDQLGIERYDEIERLHNTIMKRDIAIRNLMNFLSLK